MRIQEEPPDIKSVKQDKDLKPEIKDILINRVMYLRVLGKIRGMKHRAILYNKAEVFSLSITNPNRRPMLPFDWFIHSSLILVSCHRILFFCRFSAVEK